MLLTAPDILEAELLRTCVDIVITTFNRKEVVGHAIDSALSALVDNVIVVDDASTDGTHEFLAEKYRGNKKVQLHRCVKNIGVTGAKNVGFRISRANWVLFLDSDDTIIPSEAQRAFEILNKEIERPIVFFRCIDESGEFVGLNRGQKIDLDLECYLTHGSYGEVLTAINKKMLIKQPYVKKLRGYEGLGCARLIKKFGPALLSAIEFRIYDQSGSDRLTRTQLFSERTSLIAQGHKILCNEFNDIMPIWWTLKLKLKMSVYLIFYSVFKLLNR